MNKTIALLILGFQIALTFIVIFCIYMLFAFLDNDFGFDSLMGFFIFQPVFGVIISGATIFVCLILGLPIRVNKKLNYWWKTNFYIAVIGVIIGLTFLVLASLPAFRETITYHVNGQSTLKQIPNPVLSISGWFLTTFSLLHIYPPQRLAKRMKAIFLKMYRPQKRDI